MKNTWINLICSKVCVSVGGAAVDAFHTNYLTHTLFIANKLAISKIILTPEHSLFCLLL